MIDDFFNTYRDAFKAIIEQKKDIFKTLIGPFIILFVIDLLFTLGTYSVLAAGSGNMNNLVGNIYKVGSLSSVVILLNGYILAYISLRLYKLFMFSDKTPFALHMLLPKTSGEKAFLTIASCPFILSAIAFQLPGLLHTKSVFFSMFGFFIVIGILIGYIAYLAFIISCPFIFPSKAKDSQSRVSVIYHLSDGYRLKILLTYIASLIGLYIISSILGILISLAMLPLMWLTTIIPSLEYLFFIILFFLYIAVNSLCYIAFIALINKVICIYFEESESKNSKVLLRIEKEIEDNQTI